jgi:hypothetical protein
MKNLPETSRYQLVLWKSERVTQPTVTLTDRQQEELTAALAELLLLSLTSRKGVEDAEQD